MSDDKSLDTLLAADVDEEMRPGFDTRFQARLAEHKARGARRRVWGLAFGLSAAVAVAIAVISTRPAKEPDAATGLAIALEYELYENYDVVRDLPDLETLELLASADSKADEVIQ